jgi:hypothetical protein
LSGSVPFVLSRARERGACRRAAHTRTSIAHQASALSDPHRHGGRDMGALSWCSSAAAQVLRTRFALRASGSGPSTRPSAKAFLRLRSAVGRLRLQAGGPGDSGQGRGDRTQHAVARATAC